MGFWRLGWGAAGTQMQSIHTLWLRPAGEDSPLTLQVCLETDTVDHMGVGYRQAATMKYLVTPIPFRNASLIHFL